MALYKCCIIIIIIISNSFLEYRSAMRSYPRKACKMVVKRLPVCVCNHIWYSVHKHFIIISAVCNVIHCLEHKLLTSYFQSLHQSRDVRNGFFKFASVLRKTAGSVRLLKKRRFGSVFFVD